MTDYKSLIYSNFQDYCDKAPISVEVTFEDDSSNGYTCFKDESDPCSPEPCVIDVSKKVGNLMALSLCADDSIIDDRNGSIWEVRISEFDDYSKLTGIFVEEAQERIELLQNVPEFNTQLSFVSFVGRRGTGKSTIAAFLAGNTTMFEVQKVAKNI